MSLFRNSWILQISKIVILDMFCSVGDGPGLMVINMKQACFDLAGVLIVFFFWFYNVADKNL